MKLTEVIVVALVFALSTMIFVGVLLSYNKCFDIIKENNQKTNLALRVDYSIREKVSKEREYQFLRSKSSIAKEISDDILKDSFLKNYVKSVSNKDQEITVRWGIGRDNYVTKKKFV